MKHLLSDFVKGPVREWAKYVVEDRAIPSLVDGLKPSQRFYLYCSIIETPKTFEKVSAIGGSSSKYGYAHGETSLQGTGQRMAADWANNLLLIEGEGSFGTRLVQEAGAPRYTFTRLHKNFHKIMKDMNLCPDHEDPEIAIPKYYLPILPIVLINGTKGVATGFATDISPRSISDVSKACIEFLKTGEIKKRIPLAFPQFTGTTVWDETKQKYVHRGTFERVSKTKLNITEVPYSFDRVSYVEVLDDLEANDEIVSYTDQCGENGFRFEVTLKRVGSSDWTDEQIIKKFRLERTYTENINVIDWNGKLVHYNNELELIKDFCRFRLEIVKNRIELDIDNLTADSRFMLIKREFVRLVVDGKLSFKGKTKDDLKGVIISIDSKWATDEIAARILSTPVTDFTQEMIDALDKRMKEVNDALQKRQTADIRQEFISDLKEFA